MIRDRVMPFEIHNYAHNNQWLCTSLSHIGRVRDAIAVARNLVEQPRDPQKNGPNDGGSAQRSGRRRWAEILTRYELWDDLIEATTSGALDWSNIPLEQEQKAYTLGLAYAAKNDQAKLAEQIEALKKLTSAGAKAALAELEGLPASGPGEIGPAFDQFAKATSMRPEALARAHLAARNYGFAESTARQAVAKNPNQVAPLAALVEILHAAGKEKEARDAYRTLEPLARWADRDLPVFRRLEPIVARWKAERTWTAPAPQPANASGTDETAIDRIDLTTLGPLVWSPLPGRAVLQGRHQRHALVPRRPEGKERPGRSSSWAASAPTACSSFSSSARNTRPSRSRTSRRSPSAPTIVEATKALKNNKDGIKFPMPMLADPKLELFKLYRAYDDFESQPLHGTFLIDAQGTSGSSGSRPTRSWTSIHQDRGRAGQSDYQAKLTDSAVAREAPQCRCSSCIAACQRRRLA